jgi:NADH-quinone oxidoreductase subunit J
MIEAILFYMLSFFCVLSGVMILFSRNIVRMAYLLVGMLISVAAIYFLLGANFLGVIQMVVYVGGVAVLVVFGVMLTSRQLAEKLLPGKFETIWLTIVVLMLLFGLIAGIVTSKWTGEKVTASSTVSELGLVLMDKFLGPFELASVLLLVVLLGAAYLARPKIPTLGRPLNQKEKS